MRVDDKNPALAASASTHKNQELKQERTAHTKAREDDIERFEQALQQDDSVDQLPTAPFNLSSIFSRSEASNTIAQAQINTTNLNELLDEVLATITTKLNHLTKGYELTLSFADKSPLNHTLITLSRDNEGVLAILINCQQDREQIKKMRVIKNDLIKALNAQEQKAISLVILNEELADEESTLFHNKLLEI